MADPAIQKRLLQAVLSLPRPVLRAASGGRAVYVGGRTLDPRLQFLIHAAKHYVSVGDLPDDQARRMRAHQYALVSGRSEPGVRHEDLTFEGPRGALAVRLYRPPSPGPQMPILVYAHPGRGPEGDLDSGDAFGSILARCGHAPVLSVSCRPGPDRRFRACFEDVLAAYRFGRDNAARFEAPAGFAAIGGECLGGTFSAALCQELKRLGEPQPSLQLLIYPWLDLSSPAALTTAYADAILPTTEVEGWDPERLLSPGDDPADPLLSPLRAADLKGLAPALVVTAGFDTVVDQGEAYARRLRDADVPLVYRCYDHLVHGFVGFTGAVPAAYVACREIAGLVREGLEGRIPPPRRAAAG